MPSAAKHVAPANVRAALDSKIVPAAATATVAPAPAEILIHPPQQVEQGTPHQSNSHAAAVPATNNGQSPKKLPGNATAAVASGKNVRNGGSVTLRAAASSKLRGRPSHVLRRTTADSMTAHKDFSTPSSATRALSMRPQSQPPSTAVPEENAKSLRRVLLGTPGDLTGSSNVVKNGRPLGQRRSRFVDPSTHAHRAPETTLTAIQRQQRKVASTQEKRKAAPLTTSCGVNGATTTVDCAALPMRSSPQNLSAASTPQRASARLESTDNESREHQLMVVAEAPSATVKDAALEPALVSGLASTSVSATSANFEQAASSPADSHLTTDSSQTQLLGAATATATATADEFKVSENGDAGVSSDAVVAATAEKTNAEVGTAALHKEPVMTTEMLRDKHIVISRPSINLRAIRMTDLMRPSDAYKLTLHPTHQRSALARRSRQLSKVLNVFLTKYPLIRKLAEEMGFVMETTEEELNEYKFNLCWSDTVLSLMRLVRLRNWQRTNHFPSMHLLCRKGHLGTTLGKLRRKLPAHFAYYPRTWSMRSERAQFTQYIAAVRQRRILKYFIMKPNSGCQGRGIVVARDPLTALDEHTIDNYIVQEYVHRPLLLEGKKFDLRVYVLLTSIRHPSIFLFDDGLVRICTEPYETPNEENVKQPCKHLTNYAVNKKSSDFVYNTNVEHMDVGNKRNFGFLNRWLAEGGHSPDAFWNEVGFIIVKTILAAQPIIAKVYDSCFPTGFNDGYCCFEVLGFDILIDNKMKPWLMEVNHTPSFATETPLDFDIKSKLISEVWNIIDCKATDYEKDRQRERDEFAKRNMPPWATNHPLYGSQLRKNTSRRSAVEDPEVPLDPNPASADQQSNTVEEIPPYVHARRKLEDTKLRKFKRIYPSPNADVQLIYDLIQKLAKVESANSRLYYNSTVAAPVPTSMSSPLPSVRTNAALPSRARPPLLGPLLTTSRGVNSNSSPGTTLQQRVLATSSMPNATATGTPTDTIPDVIHIPSSPVFTSPPAAVNNTTSLTASSVSPIPSARCDGQPSFTTTITPYKLVEKDIQRSRRPSSEARSGAPTTSCTPTTRSSATLSEREVTTSPPKADVKPPQTLRVHTPRVSPLHGTHNPSSGTWPSAPQQAGAKATVAAGGGAVSEVSEVKPHVAEVHRRVAGHASNVIALKATGAKATVAAGGGAVSEVKPHVAEVHRRVAGHASNVIALKASGAKATPAENATATPLSPPLHTAVSMKENRSDATCVATSNGQPAVHQKGVMATPPHGAIASHPAANRPIKISRRTAPQKKLQTMAQGTTPSGSGPPRANSHELTSTHRKSISLNGTMPELDLSGVAHSRQKSQDRELHKPPAPTEEELARLATLQAMLDYEAAADPQPDDDDDDYNLTE